MPEEVANPSGGAMTMADAVSSLAARRAPPPDDKPEPAAEAPQEAEAAPEPQDEPEAQEPPEDDQPSDEAEPEEAEPEPERFTVKVDGEEIEVTRDELLNGYQRDADYRRKTQSLAEERKALEARVAEQNKINERLNQLAQAIEQQAGNDPEPDWVKLSQELDPWEFNKQRTEFDARQRQRAEAMRHIQAQQAEQQRRHIQTEAAKLVERIPEWRDEAKRVEGFKSLVSDAQRFFGLSPEEVNTFTDHRALLVLKDAAAFRRLQQAKPAVEKKVATAPRVVKPGSPPSKADQAAKDRDALRQKLRRTGSTDDAVAWLKARRGQ